MAPSSTSILASPLPFGADTHTHSAWRRSLSVSRTPHPNTEAVKELYKEADPKYIQDYPGFVAAARASDLALRRTSASIPPSSINDLPHRIRKVLKRHTVQLWILAAVFQINMILLTIAITLGALTAHSHGDGSTKAAAVILGLIGLLGAISSAAFGWLTWQGRQARARLEIQWAAEEELKEKRSLKEKATEEMVLKGIRDRERSLSVTRGRSRGSLREEMSRIPSFKELTPPETGRESTVVDAAPKAGKDVGDDRVPTSTDGNDRDSTWTHHLNLDDDEDEYIPPVPPVSPVKISARSSSLERDANGHGDGSLQAEEIPHRGVSPDIQQLEHQLRNRATRSTSRHLGGNTSTTSDSLSPTLHGSSPINEATAVPLINSLLAHRRALSAGNLLTTSPRSLTTTTPIQPLNATPRPPVSPSQTFPRAGNAGLGSEQSDANFRAMLDADDENEDARSEDEAIRYLRTERSREQVGRWALDLPFYAGGGVGEGVLAREEREDGRGGSRGRTGVSVGHIARLMRRREVD